MSTGLAQSVQTRLVRHAKAIDVDPSETIRPTRDADLLGFGDLAPEALRRTFAEICAMHVEPDGLIFDPDSMRVAAIRPEDAYGGQRITLLARLGPARLRVQVDVGIGDAVIPEPEWLDYPSLLDLPRPRLRAYHPETAIAEKVHAMVVLGSKNSRMRDFFDVHALAMHEPFQGERLAGALRATFERRHTAIAGEPPIAFTAAFAEVEGKRAQWAGFVRRNRLFSAPADLASVITGIAGFIGPVLAAAGRGEAFSGSWPAGGPWRRTTGKTARL
jgi:hypothetical protein